MVDAYCSRCDRTTSMEAGPTVADLTCRNCGRVYQHRAYEVLGL
jgi:transcription elongation factor Elf1